MQNDTNGSAPTITVTPDVSDQPELIGRGSFGDVYSWYGQDTAYKTLQRDDASVEALLQEHDL